MPSYLVFNACGDDLETMLRLRTSPLAVKMLRTEADIPEGAVRPKRDLGCRLAQCQAFAISRREGKTVAMLKEDHSCWGPLTGYGHIDPDIPLKFPETRIEAARMPRLEQGKYAGLVTAPLKTAKFDPDLVLIYSNNAQLRCLLAALNRKDGLQITTPLNALDSCVYSVVPALDGHYRVTLPDPGEYERACGEEDEIIFSVPADRLEGLLSQLRNEESRRSGYIHSHREMRIDFPRPEFYRRIFEIAGLE